jgi:ubiquitin C-terminal hydrolase
MKLEKYKNKGLSGLINLGNTCFLNSTLQLLSHTYELNECLNNKDCRKKIKDNDDAKILIEWNNLRNMLWKKNDVVSPNDFFNSIKNIEKIKGEIIFTQHKEHDLTEFLIFIINSFHNALSRDVNITIVGNVINDKDKIAIICFEKIKNMYEKNYSEIIKIFYAIQVSEITFINSGKINITPEPYFIVNLPIPELISDSSVSSFVSSSVSSSVLEPLSIFDCFDTYVNEEIIDGDNSIIDETTGEKHAFKKKLMFWSFPDILIINLNRRYLKKNYNMVSFPLENLNLSKYVIGYNNESSIYDLYGVGNHIGNEFTGHYTSYIKNANGNWYNYNDTNVIPLDENDVVSINAYCLFYRKQSKANKSN